LKNGICSFANAVFFAHHNHFFNPKLYRTTTHNLQSLTAMKIKSLVSVVTVILTVVLSFTSCNAPKKKVNVKLITTTDLHAAVFALDEEYGSNRGSLAQIASYVREQRSDAEQEVVLMDNGDLIQGHPAGYYFNFVAEEPVNMFAVILNELQFEAASVGNHDIEAGPDVYNHLNEEFNFPWLAANVINEKTGKPHFQPYTVVEKNGVRLAVLGLVTPSVPNWLPRKLWKDLKFESMTETARYWVNYIEQNEKPDAIVGLFHSGAGSDYLSESGNDENNSMFVARNVPGFNVVFTGHDHQSRNLTVENTEGEQVLIIAGRPHGAAVAAVEMAFEYSTDGYQLVLLEGEIIDISSYAADKDFEKSFGETEKMVSAYIDQNIGVLENTISSRNAYTGNSAFVDFIHEMQLSLSNAEVSFAAPLSFDAELTAGPISMADMFRLYPFENYLYTMQLTGAEILDALEYSYGMWFNTMKSSDDNVFLLRTNDEGEVLLSNNNRARFQNAFFNFDSAAGINYTVDLSQPAGQRITISGMASGESFAPDRTYSVAINSYRGSGGGGHLTQGAGIDHSQLEKRIEWVSDTDLRSHLAEYIKQRQALRANALDNWKLVPQDLVKPALERDMKLLFP
jgi:2',3'-cyclic-nucleotide 2'-phosphodiesterase/3'-nucleotidase